MAARYWRISGLQSLSGSLNLADLALSDGATDYATATMTGTLSSGFRITWDLGASVAIDRLKLTSVTESDFPTSFVLEQSADGVMWVSGAVVETVTYPGNAAVATVVFNDLYTRYRVLRINGTSSFADNSVTAKTVSAFGNAQISAVRSKFAAASILLDGAGDYLTVTPTAAFAFGYGDFTVSGWFYRNAVNTTPTVLEIGASNQFVGVAFIVSNSGNACVQSSTIFGSAATTTGVWQHIAWVRRGGVLTIYVNGVGNTPVNYTNNLTDTSAVRVGGVSTGNTAYYYAGHIEDLSVSNGFAEYTANFTPPTASFLPPTTGVTLPAVRSALVDSGVAAITADTPNAGLSLVGGSAAALDVYDGGTGQIFGTVAEKNLPTDIPLARRVTLIDESTRRTIREAWSSPAGDYTFSSINAARKYTVLAYDHENEYRAVVADNLTPTPQ